MIVQEHITIGGKDFVKTYSDSGFMVHGGAPESDYAEAIDPAELNRQYTETDIPIEAEAEEVVSILLGGAE